MKKVITVILICLIGTIKILAQYKDGEELLLALHKKYYQAPCKIYTFSQKNFHYRNDSVIKTSVWHEAIEFPDKFRINFGEKSKGNFVIFRNDSSIKYSKNQIQKVQPDSLTLLLILGGMYYRTFPDALSRLKSAGYKTKIISIQKYNGSEVFVIGATENDLISNQLWVNKKSFRVVRIIETNGSKESIDMRFETHQDWCNGYIETKVSFRRNGKLEQVEEYFDIKKADAFPE